MKRRPAFRLSLAALVSLTGLVALTLSSSRAFAQTTGDYRSAGTGLWNAVGTWQRYNGTTWVAAGATPTSADGVIEIMPGTVVTQNIIGLSVDQVLVDPGGQITVAPAMTWTLANGTGFDLVVFGTFLNTGGTITIGSGATWMVGPGGVFIHNTTSGIATPLGASTLDPASIFIYRGSSSLTPASSVSARTYGNLFFESTSGSWQANETGGGTLTVNGDFSIGSGVAYSTAQTGTMSFAGNFINNGILRDSTGTQTFTFTGAGKTISGAGTIAFETFNVNSGASITASSPITIAPTFTGTVASGGTLEAGAPITNTSATLAVNGTLQLDNGGSVSAAPTYGGSSTLVYNATSPGALGVEWGAGSTAGLGVPQNVTVSNGAYTLPAARTVPGNLTCNSGFGGQLNLTSGGDLTVNGTLNLANGFIFTGANKVVANGPYAQTFGYVDHNLQRAVSAAGNVKFDLGTGPIYSPVSVNFTSVGGAGSLLASVLAPVGAAPAAAGLSSTNYISRSWTLTNNGIASPTYDATFNFFPGDVQGTTNTANLIVAKNTSGTWSHPPVGTRTSSSTQVTGLSSFSDFNLGELSCPAITLAPAASALPGANTTDAYSQPITASGGTGPYSFVVTAGSLPAGLSLAAGGALTGTATALGNASFTVTATDANGCTGSAAYTLAVTCGSITVNPPSLPGATTGIAYSQAATATGGTGAYTFAVTSGSLPAGVSLAAGGALTGTPTAAGTANFDITATDANGCTGVRSYSIVVSCPTITVAPGSLPNGTQNSAYSQTVTASGGTGPYTFVVTSGTLPTGLVLATSGALTGTPSVAGTTNFDVTATDANGCTGVQPYALTIDPPAASTVAPVSASACITPAHPCQTVPVNIARGDATGMRLFHVDFQLSGNLALCGPTGANVTEGTYLSAANPNTTFLVVSNGGGSYTVDGTINGTPCGATAASGNLFNIKVTNTGGSGTGTVTITSLTLRDCANNTLASTIGGPASVTIDTAPVTVAAVATPQNVIELSTLTITPSAALTSCASGPVTWTVAPALPAGATFNTSTGEIQWTPACGTAGTYGPFTLTATAASGDAGSSNAFTIVVAHKTYTIAASAGAGGLISPSGNVAVNCGDNQAFTITPDACHTIADVLVDGVSVGAVAGYTFTNVTGNHTIAASFNVISYTIAASAGAGGLISPSGNVAVGCGSDQAFTITPDACHTIADVLVDGVSVGAVASYTFTNVTTNHTIAASFNLVSYTIAASAGAGGLISPSGSVTVGCGANQAFTITPDACHTIADVLVDGVSVGAVASYTFSNVTANHTIAASFALTSYTIAASAGAGGLISPSGNVAVGCGSDQAFTITPDACHTIADVLVDGVSVGAVASYTFTNVTANHTIAASFNLISYTIAASAGAGGLISPSGNVSVGCGANQAFTITPDACHTIADVLVDGVSVGAVASYTFTNVTTNHTIAASFALTSYTIAASAGAGGLIGPSGNVAVTCGANQAFTITPDGCHTIADVLVDGVSVGAVASYTFSNVTANHTIAASFALTSYTIVASAGAGGLISPSGNVAVGCGANQAFTITPDACHSIADVLVDGVSVGAVASYTFTNVTTNHTIAASFVHVPVVVNAPASVTATQVLLGNPPGTRTGIVVSFGSVAGAASYKVYRAPYGQYPEYDDNGGAAPAQPTTWPPAAPWTLTGVTSSGGTDTPPTRDFWYYAVYAVNACGDISAASTMTGGTLDYHLGDVSDGATPGTGDNLVDAADISLLGAHYGINLGPNDTYNYLDVGPTSTNFVDGRPVTDNRVDFEDLVMFAINYGQVTTAARTAPTRRTDATPASTNALTIESPLHVQPGDDDVVVTLAAQGTGLVQALSARLTWNADVVTLVGGTPGDFLAAQNAVLLSATPGTFDVAVLGTGQALTGTGTLVTVRFKVIGDGDPGIGIASVDARDTQNRKVVMNSSRIVPAALPTVTTLQPAAPNPSRGEATLAFSMVHRGPVDISIYTVDGRLVRNLFHGTKEPGNYSLTWDGRDARGALVSGGIFFAHMTTEHAKFTRTITRVR